MNDAGGTTPTQPFGQPVEPPEEEGGGESFASRKAVPCGAATGAAAGKGSFAIRRW